MSALYINFAMLFLKINHLYFRSQSVEINLPTGFKCDNCSLRLQRQASEWSDDYIFRSCANIKVVEGER